MFIVDIETTGLNGIRAGDKIVEVGIVKLTPEGVEDVYSAIVQHPDIEEFSDCWVFQNTDLTTEEVKNGVPEENVIRELRRILNGELATSYNVKFDFDKFLYQWPYGVFPIVPFDIMEVSSQYFNPYGDKGKWVRSEQAYNLLFPDDNPALGEKQTHRALDDARREAYILLGLLGMF